MDAKLTYLVLFTFAACLASSCTSDAPDDVDVSMRSEMSFAVAELSRASVTTSFNKFVIYGDMKRPEDDSAATKGIFSRTEVSYHDGVWSYEGIQYWMPEHEHSFVAVSPVSVLGTGNNPQYSNSRLSFTYTIPTAGGSLHKDDVADILVATHRRLFTEHDLNNTTVLRFGHVMSLINIAPALNDNIMTAGEFIGIRKIELSGFDTKATFSILPASRQSNNQTDDRVLEVGGQDSKGNMAIEFAEPVKVANDRKNVSLFADNDAIIMLPQAFAAGSDAKIVLSYTVNDDPSVKQVTLSLMNQKWESGKSYTYRFTIDGTGLLLDDTTTITDWDKLNVGNIDAH